MISISRCPSTCLAVYFMLDTGPWTLDLPPPPLAAADGPPVVLDLAYTPWLVSLLDGELVVMQVGGWLAGWLASLGSKGEGCAVGQLEVDTAVRLSLGSRAIMGRLNRLGSRAIMGRLWAG